MLLAVLSCLPLSAFIKHAHTVKQCLYDLHACLRLHTIRSATYLTRKLLSNRGSPIITVSSGKTPERELLQPV